MAVLMAFFRFMHVAFLLCLRSGSPFVACFMQGRNESDRLDLLAFKAAITSDPFGALNSWNESTHFCQWFGVTCGHRHQRVTMLRLDHQKLSGSISPHIGNLSFLRVLRLRNNSLSGEIPPEVTRLRRLQQMLFGYNTITGEIPANISACSDLITLEFSGNRLTGEIPAELGSLAKLEGLYMAKNNLAGGLPSTLGNLSSLMIFDANYNKIGGSIPATIGRWKKLEVLQLAVNYLVGTIPFSIYNLSSITDFIVPNNQIEGSLPSDLGITLYNLNILVLASNLFSGSIPITIVNATRLYLVALAENRFIGKVPSLEKLNNIEKIIFQRNLLGTGEVDDLRFLDTLTNATRLSAVSLAFNNFGGVLPESISNFSTEFLSFGLEKNKLVGSIPSGIGNLINLQFLDLSSNQLSGNIPSNIGKLQKLQLLSLSDNKFHGEIPLSFANLTLLVYLQLAQNNLRGNIPSYIGTYRVLQTLLLEHNYLSGVIPKEVSSLPSLLNLWLAYNNLSGSLPLEIGLLQNLEELDVSQNTLVGNLPSSIGSCVKLTSLNMEGNKLWGTIPSTFSTLRGLEELDLSHNNLSGKIPDYLDGFVFLKKLNLSFNDFEGALPESGVFKNVTAISIEGNKKLCGGIPELQLQSCNSQGSRNKGFTLTVKLIVSISLGLLGLLLLSFLILYRFRKTTKVPAVKFLGNSFLQLSYQSLLKATDGFSPANLIGVGSFGSVYKGVFDEGRKVVAVKVLNLRFQGASKSFIAECKALKSIKHRNLVKILTVCASVDYQGNDFKALVYEFMVNGTLEEWLHPNNHDDDAHEESRRLNFEQKLNIAIDVASALNYLHNLCSEPIVHCDLKPSNVLLDEELIAHVGDFGIARFLLEATSDSTFENQSSSIGIRGSIGYTAPEYGTGNEVSPSGDVYSYGVLLLEMFIGKRPTESMFIDSLTLHNFAKMALLEKVTNFVDPTFQQREMEETSSCIQTAQNNCSSSTHKIEECLVSVIKIGIACSHELPTDRMDIKDVVTQLHAIRNTMLETGARSTKLLDDHEQFAAPPLLGQHPH